MNPSNLHEPGSRPCSRNAWYGDDEVTKEADLEAYGSADSYPAVVNENNSGCWYGFKKTFCGMWSTRQLDNKEDKTSVIKTTLRELVVYILFLIVLCVITFSMMNPVMYYHTKVLSELFLDSSFEDGKSNLRGSNQMVDFWRFAQTAMLDNLYWNQNYNGKQLEEKNILYENRLLGSPRLRQLRVRNDSCNVHSDFKSAILECFDVYSPHIEDQRPFGVMNGSAWYYHSEKMLNGSNHWGMIGSYSGAGSYIDLGTDKERAKEILTFLKDNLWISRATRAAFLDFTVYNANINLFCVAKLVFEFPATGGMIPSWSFRTVKLIRYVSQLDQAVFACEVLFCFFIAYYMIEEFLEIKKNRCSYFSSIWNILDVLVIVLSFLCITFSFYRSSVVDSKLESLLDNAELYPNFENLGFWQTQFNHVIAVTVFFSWVKIFKYISFNKTMNQLSSTLSRCSKDIAGFAIMFFIVFFAFAQLGYLLFGTQVKDYSDFVQAVFTLLRLILGDFDFHELEAANRVLGPIYFLSYVFFVFFVLMNMFLAIINDTYAEVKSEISSGQDEFEIMDFLKKGYQSVVGKLSKHNKLVGLQNALKLADKDGDSKLSFAEVRQTLKQQNYSDLEIETIFAKYDIDGDRELDQKETLKMLEDLEGQRKVLEQEIYDEQSGVPEPGQPGTGVCVDDFNVLTRRVDRMEHSIGSIVSKIDAVLVKMESIDKMRAKRRESMSKILDEVSQNESMDDVTKRKEMEKLVREEIQQWDNDSTAITPNEK